MNLHIKIKPILLLFLMSILFIVSSCKKEKPADPVIVPSEEEGKVTGTVGGYPWRSSSTEVNFKNGRLFLRAYGGRNESYYFILSGLHKGDYYLNDTADNLSMYTEDDNIGLKTFRSQDSGMLRITEVDEVAHTISGEFSLNSPRWGNHRIIDGKFNKLKYGFDVPSAAYRFFYWKGNQEFTTIGGNIHNNGSNFNNELYFSAVHVEYDSDHEPIDGKTLILKLPAALAPGHYTSDKVNMEFSRPAKTTIACDLDIFKNDTVKRIFSAAFELKYKTDPMQPTLETINGLINMKY